MNKHNKENNSESRSPAPVTVALYVTCLADLMRPSVAKASWDLLTRAGCDVEIPKEQSCCGQPGYNSGDYSSARRIAQQVIERFEDFDYVVLPSGSCAGMLIEHYPKLFEGEWLERASKFSTRVYELTSFLLEVMNYRPPKQDYAGKIAYHDSCAGMRELNIRQQPRTLLARTGIKVQELSQRDVCCGFGGTFCAKMPAISGDMADKKIRDAEATGADTLIAGDLGCLLSLAGRARRTKSTLHFRHVAELLVGDTANTAIGESNES